MRRIRGYTLELVWLFLLIAVLLFTPTRSSASAFDWVDLALDCSSDEGWCVPIDLDDYFQFFRSEQ